MSRERVVDYAGWATVVDYMVHPDGTILVVPAVVYSMRDGQTPVALLGPIPAFLLRPQLASITVTDASGVVVDYQECLAYPEVN